MKFYKKSYLIIILLININCSMLQKTIKVVRPIIKDHYNDVKANPIDYSKYALKKIYLSKPSWALSIYTHYNIFNQAYDKFEDYKNIKMASNAYKEYSATMFANRRLIKDKIKKIKQEEKNFIKKKLAINFTDQQLANNIKLKIQNKKKLHVLF